MVDERRGERPPRQAGQADGRAQNARGRRVALPSYVSPYARSGGSRVAPGGGRSGAAARAIRPRGAVETLGRRRRSPVPVIVLGVAALVIVVGGVTWWLLTRPAAVTLSAKPSDARITLTGARSQDGAFTGSKATTGVLEAGKLRPGTYHVKVERGGFESVVTTVELARGTRLERTIALPPMPLVLSFTTRPSGASVSVARAGGEPVTGTTPCKLTVYAGDVTVSLGKSGYNAFERKVFLDAARDFDVLLDPRGQLVHAVGSITTKGAPKGVALTPNGREAWSAILNGPPSIQIFDPVTAKITGSIDLGRGGAEEVIFNRAGTRAYASQMETKLHETSKVFEMDVATRSVLRTFDTKSTMTKAIALARDEKTLYAANWAGNDVSVIDLKTGTVLQRIGVAKTPRGLYPTANGKSLYVAGFGTGDLQRIDLALGAVTTLFKSGGAMRHLVADEKAGKLYASDMGKDTVWVLDMKTDKVTKFASTDHKPNTIDLSPDGRILFVSNRGANNPKSYYLPGYEWGSILLFETATGKPLDAVVGGNQCTALDVSKDGKTLVFSDFLDNRLRVYQVPAYSVLAAGNGGRYAAHSAALKKRTPGTAASSGAVAP